MNSERMLNYWGKNNNLPGFELKSPLPAFKTCQTSKIKMKKDLMKKIQKIDDKFRIYLVS